MKAMKTRVAVVAIVMMSSVSHAALVDRGGGLIYDDVLDVTWLADANLPRTESFGVNGISPANSQAGNMSWYTAQSWLAALNTSNYLGYSDWRLPRVRPVNGVTFNENFSTNGSTDRGYNITSVNSELAHLANVDLRSLNGCIEDVWTGTCPIYNFGLFENINTRYTYYTETEVYPGSDQVRAFSFYSSVSSGSVNYDWGFQSVAGKSDSGLVMVLRDGDVVSPAPVPVPAAWGLLLVGLGAMRLMSRVRAH